VALTAAQLTPLAHAAIAVRYTKMNNFQGWVKAIGVLLEDGYYTIARGNYYMLDSGTEELQLFLRLNGVRQVDLDFVGTSAVLVGDLTG
jgi:hypothetical protein